MTINFRVVAMDQVVNHAAKIGAMFGGEVRCPLVIRTPNGPIYKQRGTVSLRPDFVVPIAAFLARLRELLQAPFALIA